MFYGRSQYITHQLKVIIKNTILEYWGFAPTGELSLFVEDMMDAIDFGYLDSYISNRLYTDPETIKGRVNYNNLINDAVESIKDAFLRIRSTPYWQPKRSKEIVLVLKKGFISFEKDRKK
jgi:hypothetical protein